MDAIVTDPPYGLEFMGKEWDHGIPAIPFWTEALRVAKPGCHLLAFGGGRTHHRLMIAIEDAGWEIRDTLMWVYGSGFPKSHDVSKAIDKAAGAKRNPSGIESSIRIPRAMSPCGKEMRDCDRSIRHDIPATDAARQWEGWGTALKPAWEPIIMARKPLEGTVAANVQKWGTGAINVDGCRIAISDEDKKDIKSKQNKRDTTNNIIRGFGNNTATHGDWNVSRGRWPSNFIHDGSEEVLELFPETISGGNIRRKPSPSSHFGSGSNESVIGTIENHGDSGSAARFFYCAHPDRINLLFSRAKHIMDSWKNELANTVDESLSLSNQVVASVLSGAVIVASQGAKQLSDVRGLSTSVTPSELRRISETLITAILCSEKKPSPDQSPDAPFPNGCLVNYAEIPGQTDTIEIMISRWKSDGSAVSATFKITPANSDHGGKDFASRFIYCAKASRAEREAGCEGMDAKVQPATYGDIGPMDGNPRKVDTGHIQRIRNAHPCVKPLALMRYLCRLVTPPNGTVLDPFAGSGSTLIAAIQEGFNCIGIEKDVEYVAIAEARIVERRIEVTEWRAR